jgi:hypothetical protein
MVNSASDFLLVDERIRNRRNNCGSGSRSPKANGASDPKNTGADIEYPPFKTMYIVPVAIKTQI